MEGEIWRDAASIRYRAKRCGFYAMQTRGIEARRRREAGVGTWMLLSANGVEIFATTLGGIAEFLEQHGHKAKPPRLH